MHWRYRLTEDGDGVGDQESDRRGQEPANYQRVLELLGMVMTAYIMISDQEGAEASKERGLDLMRGGG